MSAADFTIADVLEWARTKPADERYAFEDSRACALAQFGIVTHRPHLVGIGDLRPLYPALAEALNPLSKHALSFGHSFGALVTRLEALLPAEPLSDTWTTADAYLTDIEDVARERVMS